MEKIVILASLLSLASCGGLNELMETRGKIVQYMTLGLVANDSQNNLKGEEVWIKIKEAINEVIVRVYGHPKDQTSTRLVSPGFFILTFYTEGNSQKDSLLALINNIWLLIPRLNEVLQRNEILSKVMVEELSQPLYTDTSGSTMCWYDYYEKVVRSCEDDIEVPYNCSSNRCIIRDCSNINCVGNSDECAPSCPGCETKSEFCRQSDEIERFDLEKCFPNYLNGTMWKYNDTNMNDIAKDLEDLKDINETRKTLDDLVVAHENLANEKDDIYMRKIALDLIANSTVKGIWQLEEIMDGWIPGGSEGIRFNETKTCMIGLLNLSKTLINQSIEFIFENFEDKRFDNLLSIELKLLILKGDVEEILNPKEDLTEAKDKLIDIANKLIEEIRNAYQFLRHQFTLINEWKYRVEKVESFMTNGDFELMIDSECGNRYLLHEDKIRFAYTLMRLEESSEMHRSPRFNPVDKLFLGAMDNQ